MENFSMLDTFPRDIIAEILSRLPVESLFRLKSLNKSWYFFILCLLKDSEFVAKHLRHAESSPTMLLVCEQKRGFFKLLEKNSAGLSEDIFDELQALAVQFRVGDSDDDTIHCTARDFNLPHCLSHINDCNLTGYYCNGIVCLAGYSASNFALYNPALCEFDMFNPSTKLVLAKSRVIGIGFGCDSTGSLYKVVRLFENMTAEVFVPGGDRDCWKEINTNIEERPLLPFEYLPHVHLKGNCFWSMDDTVLCFDVGREVFHNIPLPEEAADHGIHSLSRCNDSIRALMGSGVDTQVWALDANCSRGGCVYSWKKLLVAPWCERNICLKRVWDSENCELLIDSEYEEMIESYNFRDGNARRLPFRLRSEKVYYLDRYIESLVSVKSINKPKLTEM